MINQCLIKSFRFNIKYFIRDGNRVHHQTFKIAYHDSLILLDIQNELRHDKIQNHHMYLTLKNN
jgi:hypothetical protein